MLPVKEAVALAIRRESELLVVKRPANDESLPNVWGLPAGARAAGEQPATAAVRAGREKLGIDVEIVRQLAAGELQRPGYLLRMQLFEARIRAGAPAVPQPYPAVTQYQAWKWALPDVLREAAQKGSLCCRLYLSVLK